MECGDKGVAVHRFVLRAERVLSCLYGHKTICIYGLIGVYIEGSSGKGNASCEIRTLRVQEKAANGCAFIAALQKLPKPWLFYVVFVLISQGFPP